MFYLFFFPELNINYKFNYKTKKIKTVMNRRKSFGKIEDILEHKSFDSFTVY